ncbi:MAG: penicillin-binding protein 2, partial [Planctomycetes bacterium]|nr:penicillin-binding protein 2 [Planctomycetota bacterium]
MVPLEKHKLLVNIIGTFLIAAFIALIVRLGSVQITDHDTYVELAKQQQLKKINLPARRGMILDRNGTRLAESLQLGSVCAYPPQIKDVKTTAHQLSKVLKLKQSELTRRLVNGGNFVLIKRKVNDKDVDAVEKLSLKGIYIEREYHRFYPNRQLAAHVIGSTDANDAGTYGIELVCNDTLTGEPGYKITGRDALQRQITTPDAEFKAPVHGEDVVLTIDANIQRFAEEELEAACKKWAPLNATAIVIDPMTAEVLALANYPTFDPNQSKTYSRNVASHDVRKNIAITDCYEPGSIMKPIVVSGVFEQGLAKPGDMVYCEDGVWRINGHTMHDSHKGYGNLTVTDVIALSSNIGTGKLGLRLGSEKLYKHLKQFNFGEKTGIELPGESRGIFNPLKSWYKSSVENISIGQGIAVTSLQFITAFCSIPNGGQLLKPSIIKSKERNDDNTVKNVSGQKVVRRVMSERVARDIMNPILRKVV